MRTLFHHSKLWYSYHCFRRIRWTINQGQHLPTPQTEWDAENCGCPGRTDIHRNEGSVLEHNVKQGGLDKINFGQVKPKWMQGCTGKWRCWCRYCWGSSLIITDKVDHSDRRGYRSSGASPFPLTKWSKWALLQIWQIKRHQSVSYQCSEQCVGEWYLKTAPICTCLYRVWYHVSHMRVWERSLWSRSWSRETRFL